MARFGGKELTMEDFLRIAGGHDYDSIEFVREILQFSADSLRRVGEERYGKDWGQNLVMHTEHGPALTLLLQAKGEKRKATKLEELDSLSGRIVVQATGTTGMDTIEKAKPLWNSSPTKPGPILPVPDPQTGLILEVLAELAEESAAREKLASLQAVAKEVGAAVGKITGGAPVRKIKAELDKLLKAVG